MNQKSEMSNTVVSLQIVNDKVIVIKQIPESLIVFLDGKSVSANYRKITFGTSSHASTIVYGVYSDTCHIALCVTPGHLVVHEGHESDDFAQAIKAGRKLWAEAGFPGIDNATEGIEIELL